MAKIIGYIVIAAMVAGVGYGIYSYQNGLDFKLYDEAKQLESEGKIDEAFATVKRAMEVNPKNRKVQLYRTELNFVVENNKLLEQAKVLRQEAVKLTDRAEYREANDKLSEASDKLLNISPSFKKFDEVLELDKQLIEDIARIKREAPIRYYTQARGYFSSGEYERAYNIIDYIIEPDERTLLFKYQIAYTIANRSYNKIETSGSRQSQIRDAIYWYSLVGEQSQEYINAQEQIRVLNNMLNKK